MKTIKQTEANIKSGITRIYKEVFGQGPDSIYVNLWDNVLTCELVGALTCLEATLIVSREGEELVHSIRNHFLSVGGTRLSTGWKNN
ncbi:MAG: Na-translocating system protein MpsC family protein [Desulfitobacteriaceae bacterium]|nr:Na-translocating system protein MpsC family protein [Desulfitobacteriaceae bacterium]MDD4401826.1 Na-translocating system protein MpsC family protein [Desulfitobacteriaceae bacterium]